MLDRSTLEAEAAAVEPVERPPALEIVRRGRRRRRARLAARAAAAAAAGAAVWVLAGSVAPDDSPPAPAAPRADSIAFVKDGAVYLVPLTGGRPSRLTEGPAVAMQPAWSPDGERLAFVRALQGARDIYVLDLASGDLVRLTSDPAPDLKPAWSPDGTKIAFVRNVDGNEEIFVMDATGGAATQLTRHAMTDSSPTWSPDGTTVAFARDYGDERAIMLQRIDETEATHLTSGSFDSDPAWWPGERIAFVRDVGGSIHGQRDVFVVDADGTGLAQLTDDPASQHEVAWFPDGERLSFFEIPDISRGPYEFGVHVMDADGTGKRRVTRWLDWLPDPAPRP